MATAAPPSGEECPVCHDDFTDPKILPCLHLVCGHCLLSWLQAGGSQAGCPLCRAAVLQPQSAGQDLASVVDDLPTDIITKAAVDSRRMLNEKHVCICDDSTKATCMCMQCSIKLCSTCVKTHRVIPATRDHEIEPISSLTVDKLATSYQSSCRVHPGRQVEQFCSSHQELICLNCSTSTHRGCPNVEEVAAAAMVRRQELREHARQLENKTQEMQTQILQLDAAAGEAQKKFKAMKDKVKTTFDELRSLLDKRCLEAMEEIQKKEDDYLKENRSQKQSLEKQRARCVASSNTVSRLVSAPDDPLLAMLVKLKAHLEDAELLCPQTPVAPQGLQAAELGDFFFDQQATASLKELIAKHGQMRYHPTPRKPPSRKAQTGSASAEAMVGPDKQGRITGLVMPRQSEEPLAFRFHCNHGQNIVLSNNQHTAERKAGYGEGIVMCVEAMKVNMLYEVRVDETLSDWDYEAVYLGVVTQCPDSLTLPADGWSGHMASAVVVHHDWVKVNGELSGSSVGGALSDVREGSRVGLALDDQHSLHLYIDRHSQGVVAPYLTQPCYFMVDLHACWKKVTALPVRPVT